MRRRPYAFSSRGRRSSGRERFGVCRMLSRQPSRNSTRFRNSGRQRSWESSWRLGSRRRFRDMAVPAGLPILYYSVLPGRRCALGRRFPRPTDFSEVPLWSVSDGRKLPGQFKFNESLSAKPPPDVFWRVRSCISLPVGFSTSGREVPVPGQCGSRGRFRGQSNSDGRELRLQNEMLTWKTSQLGFPLERAWSSLKTGKIVTEA